MKDKVLINDIDSLCNWILETNPNEDELYQVLHSTLKIWTVKQYDDKKLLCDMLRSFVAKYPSITERPLFLEVPNDKIEPIYFYDTD